MEKRAERSSMAVNGQMKPGVDIAPLYPEDEHCELPVHFGVPPHVTVLIARHGSPMLPMAENRLPQSAKWSSFEPMNSQ